jgi:integrase
VADRSRRLLALIGFLTDIIEWDGLEAPPRKLLFRDDIPKLPQTLPRSLPVDIDRRLTPVLTTSPGNELAAAVLRMQRSCGLRIGELLDLELDCVHEVPGHGNWLKVPLGKLDTERMVPIDEDILELLDHIAHIRSPGRPLTHPRYRRPAQFLFTHRGRRLGQQAVRAELDRPAGLARLEHITPHQLRHTYASALVNARIFLQA